MTMSNSEARKRHTPKPETRRVVRSEIEFGWINRQAQLDREAGREVDPRRYAQEFREWLKEEIQTALTDALHPEFGTEWREPDGVIYKAVQQAKGEQ